MSLLISEPPLVVLPSLAREVGLTDAIVLQQLWFAGQREPEGWVVRSAADWSRALRGVVAARSLERIFPKLVEGGWAEAAPVAGKPTGYRVSARKLAEVTSAKLAGDVPASSGGSAYIEKKGEKESSSKGSQKAAIRPEDEPIGFAQWLGYHVIKAAELNLSMSVPRAMTSYRGSLARTFKRLQDEGYSTEDFELASDGVLSDEYMRTNGHVKPENVLRVEKIGGRIENGRLYRAAKAKNSADGKYDFLGGSDA